MSETTGFTLFGLSAICLLGFGIFKGCENDNFTRDRAHTEAMHQIDVNAELAKRCLDNDGVWVASQCVYPHQSKAKP